MTNKTDVTIKCTILRLTRMPTDKRFLTGLLLCASLTACKSVRTTPSDAPIEGAMKSTAADRARMDCVLSVGPASRAFPPELTATLINRGNTSVVLPFLKNLLFVRVVVKTKSTTTVLVHKDLKTSSSCILIPEPVRWLAAGEKLSVDLRLDEDFVSLYDDRAAARWRDVIEKADNIVVHLELQPPRGEPGVKSNDLVISRLKNPGN